MRKTENQKGQISIFLGIAIMVIVGFLGFVINVGLFVKAKINLQNAVDAAAFSGAAVQSRQLTNIAYLNFELRNTFKEWMFKYYILGQKGIQSTELGNIFDGTLNPGSMNFRLRPFYKVGHPDHDPNMFDKFNVPSICIHYGSPHNICEIVSVPGLPRFDTIGLPSISKHHDAFLDNIVKTKSEDCSHRSAINMGAAMLWAYGTAGSALFSDIPRIASTRPGAWIEAIELAIRIRNLEMMVNIYPQTTPVCANTAAGNCTDIQSIDAQSTNLPLRERTQKAFWAGYRNISGGVTKRTEDIFANTFKLTELAPNPFIANDGSLSSFLIPQERSEFFTKHYLDLQIYPINYVTFFTMFSSASGELKNDGTPSQADCGSMKAALPVPGYILGFTKNHKVLTYYPVKGTARFVGLFFPFTETRGIELTAYAAAKPMGGRIGPKLFQIDPADNTTIVPRQSATKMYTANYASTLDVDSLTGPERLKIAGIPLPSTSSNFWADQAANRILGGNPTQGNRSFYSIPNIIYDFDDVANLGALPTQTIQELDKASSFGQAYNFNMRERSGLYNKEQFNLFARNQSQVGILDRSDVLRSIINARRATKYDALNYMVPVLTEQPADNPAGVDHNSYVIPSESGVLAGGNPDLIHYNLFGPLFGPDALYSEISTIISTVQEFLQFNQSAFDTYLSALEDVADTMLNDPTMGNPALYQQAASFIFNGDTPVTFGVNDPNCAKLSLSQKFATFFKGQPNTSGCGIIPLPDKVIEHFETRNSEDSSYQNYYRAPYSLSAAARPPPNQLMTGYMPGRRQGAFENGDVLKPASSETLSSKRNFYSTKLFAMEKVIPGASNDFSSPPLYLEGNSGGNFEADTDIQTDPNVVNTLQGGQLSEFNTIDF